MTPSEQKKLEAAEGGKERARNKLEKLMDRGRMVGGVVGGAALAAVLDNRLKPIWGLPPSLFAGALGVGAVSMGWIPNRNGNEETVLSLSLGMIAPAVNTRTAAAIRLSKLFGGGNGNGNGNGNGGA